MHQLRLRNNTNHLKQNDKASVSFYFYFSYLHEKKTNDYFRVLLKTHRTLK
jgi:hypothetical protein